MCQGSLAAEQLMPLESDGVVVVNRPSSALNCHRYRLVKRIGDSMLAFPRTLILASSAPLPPRSQLQALSPEDRKSTRLNSSHLVISYAVFCLKKKKELTRR